MQDQEKIWYAAAMTRIVFSPESLLQTFGETDVHYFVLSDLLDAVGQVRVRQGRIIAERPKVITPNYFLEQALENFGEDAQRYVELLLSQAENMRILRYGLRFRKQEYSEELVHGNMEEISERVAEEARRNETELCGVIVGVDDMWEVSLLKFAAGLIRKSAPHNLSELAGRGLLDSAGNNVPSAVRIEIESDFRGAVGDRKRIRQLGEKLRRYGLYAEYEDRFYELVKAAW
jgi:hypothetical protein